MKLGRRAILLLALCALVPCSAWSSSPCGGVDRSLTEGRKAALAPKIAGQLHVQSAEVYESFRLGNWTILFVDSPEADAASLFYSHDPSSSRYVALWGGGAAPPFEEENVRNWVFKNVPGIPRKLATCFAWYVTSDRGLKGQGN